MNIRYIHEQKFSDGSKALSNIMWDHVGKWPTKAGNFPPEHPFQTNTQGVENFKEKGYRVYPFPEGDGCSLDLPDDQSREQVIADIEECFGWTVKR